MKSDLVAVALPLPFQMPFTYRLPRGVAPPPPGCRVQVPFGPRRVIGVVNVIAVQKDKEWAVTIISYPTFEVGKNALNSPVACFRVEVETPPETECCRDIAAIHSA